VNRKRSGIQVYVFPAKTLISWTTSILAKISTRIGSLKIDNFT
jgi:hypothetical protein